ncbi:hypothetical protein ACNUDN_10070 [Mycobacterium sp. smrl_JER01]|uniref:hypothetical protein n=1 Tax=Mycobacterium sp. smrl_JER01 TaxID=3402633 RepID=UPI003AD63E74
MSRRQTGWPAVVVLLAVIVAFQVGSTSSAPSHYIAQADIPTVAPGADVLDGLAEVPFRLRGNDHCRTAFGESWTDDTTAAGGRNGCDTRFLGGFGVLPGTLQEAEFMSGTLR